MSATTAIQSVATPAIASTRNAALSTIENAMFARMLRTVARLRRSAYGIFSQLVGHQRDVGGVERRGAAGDAHGNADIGAGERRRVVDAVADHRHAAESRAATTPRFATLSAGSRPACTSSTPTASLTTRAAVA